MSYGGRQFPRDYVQGMPGSLEEDVGLIGFLGEETQIEMSTVPVFLDLAGGHSQLEAAVAVLLFFGTGCLNEEGQVLNGQSPEQAVGHRFQHLVEVGFGTQLTGKLHQSAAVIVTVLIE